MSNRICACLGPINGDPYCPCMMRDKGLEMNQMSYSKIDTLGDDTVEYSYQLVYDIVEFTFHKLNPKFRERGVERIIRDVYSDGLPKALEYVLLRVLLKPMGFLNYKTLAILKIAYFELQSKGYIGSDEICTKIKDSGLTPTLFTMERYDDC